MARLRAPLLRSASGGSAWISYGDCWLGTVHMADSFLDRLLGWFRFNLHLSDYPRTRERGAGHSPLQSQPVAHCGVLLSPCAAVHTLGMPCCIDLVFFDRHLRVCKLVYGFRPWRGCVSLSAHGVIELLPGSIPRGQLSLGDVITVTRTVVAESPVESKRVVPVRR